MPTYDEGMQSVDDASPIELYSFAVTTKTIRLTNRDFPYEWDGAIYSSEPISTNAQKIGSERIKNELKITVGKDSEVVADYVKALPKDGIAVIIYRLHEKPDGSGTTEVLPWWQGQVLSVSFEGSQATLTCSSTLSALNKVGLRLKYSPNCSHYLYREGCGLQFSFWADQGQVFDISPDGLTLTVDVAAGNPDNYYVNGLAKIGEQYRMITGHTGTQITLLVPFEDIGYKALIQVAPGCDRTIQTCQSKFNNVVNFGGWPYIPYKNPFSSGLT